MFGRKKIEYKKIIAKPIEFEEPADEPEEESEQMPEPVASAKIVEPSQASTQPATIPTDEELLDALEGSLVRIVQQAQRSIQVISVIRQRIE